MAISDYPVKGATEGILVMMNHAVRMQTEIPRILIV